MCGGGGCEAWNILEDLAGKTEGRGGGEGCLSVEGGRCSRGGVGSCGFPSGSVCVSGGVEAGESAAVFPGVEFCGAGFSGGKAASGGPCIWEEGSGGAGFGGGEGAEGPSNLAHGVSLHSPGFPEFRLMICEL